MPECKAKTKFSLMFTECDSAKVCPKVDFFFIVQESHALVIFLATFYKPTGLERSHFVAKCKGERQAQERSIAVYSSRLAAFRS